MHLLFTVHLLLRSALFIVFSCLLTIFTFSSFQSSRVCNFAHWLRLPDLRPVQCLAYFRSSLLPVGTWRGASVHSLSLRWNPSPAIAITRPPRKFSDT